MGGEGGEGGRGVPNESYEDAGLPEGIWNGYVEKKNGAACLDPWEIFVLLALKILFHFISLRKLENYLQF